MRQSEKVSRSFHSGEVRCKNNCQYCFSMWKNAPIFLKSLPTASVIEKLVAYPVCDSEALIQNETFWTWIADFLSTNENSVVSISTKSIWSEEKLSFINKLMSGLPQYRIKLGVSFSCKNNIGEIEPNAASYSQRIEMLRRIESLGIPHNVMLKPLLPFVSFSEYCQIINDCLPYCLDFVVGDLYVEKDSLFVSKFGLDEYKIQKRYCDWMGRDAFAIEYPHRDKIIEYLHRVANVYESDVDFCKMLFKRRCK